MPVSSNVSKQPEIFVDFSASSKSCLRTPVRASSSKSTSSPYGARRSRSWIDSHIKQVGQPSAVLVAARPSKNQQLCTARCVSQRLAHVSMSSCQTSHKHIALSSAFARYVCSLIVKPVNASPIGASCVQSLGAVQLLQHALVCRRALLANHSLNRTVCGRPLQAVISFSALRTLPQTAG